MKGLGSIKQEKDETLRSDTKRFNKEGILVKDPDDEMNKYLLILGLHPRFRFTESIGNITLKTFKNVLALTEKYIQSEEKLIDSKLRYKRVLCTIETRKRGNEET